MPKAELSENEVITPIAILSYPHLFEPNAYNDGDKPKYRATLVFPPEVQETPEFERMIDATEFAAIDEWGESKTAKLNKAGKLRFPFLQDEDDESDYPEGSYFIRATTTRQPTILRWDKEEIEDPEQMYPGALVRAYLVAKAYTHKMNRGVSFYLQHIQKVGDGERLAGRKKAASVFDAVDPIGNAEPEDDDESTSHEDLDNKADIHTSPGLPTPIKKKPKKKKAKKPKKKKKAAAATPSSAGMPDLSKAKAKPKLKIPGGGVKRKPKGSMGFVGKKLVRNPN